MRTPIGDYASRVVPEPAEGTQEPVSVKRHQRRGPEVEVPIQLGRRVGVRLPADAPRMHIAEVPDADEMHLAQLAGLDNLCRPRNVRSRTLLRANLNDSAVFACRSNDGSLFPNVMSEWLLDIRALTRLTGEHRGDGMPVVRCAISTASISGLSNTLGFRVECHSVPPWARHRRCRQKAVGRVACTTPYKGNKR